MGQCPLLIYNHDVYALTFKLSGVVTYRPAAN